MSASRRAVPHQQMRNSSGYPSWLKPEFDDCRARLTAALLICRKYRAYVESLTLHPTNRGMFHGPMMAGIERRRLKNTERMKSTRISRVLTLLASLLTFEPAMAADVYKLTVTREEQDLYAVQGSRIYIKTKVCFQFVYSDEAILRVGSPRAIIIGKIFFPGGASCNVEEIFRA